MYLSAGFEVFDERTLTWWSRRGRLRVEVVWTGRAGGKTFLRVSVFRGGRLCLRLRAFVAGASDIIEYAGVFEVVGGDSFGNRERRAPRSPSETPPLTGFPAVEFPDALI